MNGLIAGPERQAAMHKGVEYFARIAVASHFHLSSEVVPLWHEAADLMFGIDTYTDSQPDHSLRVANAFFLEFKEGGDAMATGHLRSYEDLVETASSLRSKLSGLTDTRYRRFVRVMIERNDTMRRARIETDPKRYVRLAGRFGYLSGQAYLELIPDADLEDSVAAYKKFETRFVKLLEAAGYADWAISLEADKLAGRTRVEPTPANKLRLGLHSFSVARKAIVSMGPRGGWEFAKLAAGVTGHVRNAILHLGD